MKSKWILLFCLIGFVMLTGTPSGVLAADTAFPTKPINLYVGMGAGGSCMLMARIVSQRASEILGQPIIVIAKPGATGTLCNDFVRRAKPDGYTLTEAMLANNVAALLSLPNVPYTVDDFEYICLFCNNPMIMYVSSESPWKTLQEVIAYGKENPGKLKYPSVGSGSSADIAAKLLSIEAKIQTVNIPFKLDTECLASVLGGHCQFSMAWLTQVVPVKDTGKIRFLASASDKRLPMFPDVPTFIEKGLPSVVYSPWYGIAGPKGIPREVLDKLIDAFGKASQDEEVKIMLKNIGVNPDYIGGSEFDKFVHSEFKKVQEIFKKVGLTDHSKKSK